VLSQVVSGVTVSAESEDAMMALSASLALFATAGDGLLAGSAQE
jgi:hypothetical protein